MSYILLIDNANFDYAEFDVKSFQSLLQLLSLSINTENYCIKTNELSIDNIDFDIDSVRKSFEIVSTAITLEKEINNLEKSIDNDISLLNDINLKLESIKVCPLCGKPM